MEERILAELQKLNGKFDKLEGRFDKLESEVSLLKEQISENTNMLKALSHKTDMISAQQATIARDVYIARKEAKIAHAINVSNMEEIMEIKQRLDDKSI